MAASITPPAVPPSVPRRRAEAEPRRRRPVAAPGGTPLRTRLLKGMLMFAGAVLLVDSLVGERGFLETRRAQQAAAEVAGRIAALRQENAALRESVRLLREDPATIEAEARRQLGLIKPGELLFILKDARPPVPDANR